MDNRTRPTILYTVDPTGLPGAVDNEIIDLAKGDANGVMWTRPHIGTSPITADNPDADGIAPANVYGQDVRAFNYVWDSTNSVWDRETRVLVADNLADAEARRIIAYLVGYDGANWDRLKAGANNTDNQAVETAGVLKILSHLMTYNTDTSTFDRLISGQTAADGLATTTTGVLKVLSHLLGFNGTGFDRIFSGGNDTDAQAETNYGILKILSHKLLYNGTSWDRQTNNHELTLMTLLARTQDSQSANTTNYNSLGAVFTIDATAATGAPSVIFNVQGYDTLSGKYYTILSSAAITGISTTQLTVYPGITVTANVSAADILPRIFRIQADHTGTDSLTYSASCSLAA